MTNWTVLGAGAIGGLFACELKAAGIDVTLINRAHLSLTNRSFAIERENHRQSYEFSIQPSESAIQQLILATKTYQSEAAITQIEQLLSENCIIVVLQNGMGTTEWLQSKFPKAFVLAATTTHGAFRSDPDTIVHAGMGRPGFEVVDRHLDTTIRSRSEIADVRERIAGGRAAAAATDQSGNDEQCQNRAGLANGCQKHISR